MSNNVIVIKPMIDAKALRIAAARASKDASQIAKETGLTQRSIERLLKTDQLAKLSTVGKIAETLNVDVEEIARFE